MEPGTATLGRLPPKRCLLACLTSSAGFGVSKSDPGLLYLDAFCKACFHNRASLSSASRQEPFPTRASSRREVAGCVRLSWDMVGKVARRAHGKCPPKRHIRINCAGNAGSLPGYTCCNSNSKTTSDSVHDMFSRGTLLCADTHIMHKLRTRLSRCGVACPRGVWLLHICPFWASLGSRSIDSGDSWA